MEAFDASSFRGRPNNTYERLTLIRDNEAGHRRIFQDSISPTSNKPGACQYQFGFKDAESFLALQVLLELTSEALLTGLVIQAQLNETKGALTAIGETEGAHNTWALINNYDADPFTGPVNTVFPYANELLDLTNQFVVPGSCPNESLVYPTPRQNLSVINFNQNTTTATPGAEIEFIFSKTPEYPAGEEVYAVFFHGILNITIPFETTTNKTRIPPQFDDYGLIIAVVATEPGLPTLESVIAGPLNSLQQPSVLTLKTTG